MTKEETKEQIAHAQNLIDVMQAYVDGKQIQSFHEIDKRWEDIADPNWFQGTFYRIKPESKYRSFKNVEECWQEMLKHQPFGWIKSKRDYHYSMVTVVGADDNMKSLVINGHNIWRFDETMSDYTFADGTAFGVRENF